MKEVKITIVDTKQEVIVREDYKVIGNREVEVIDIVDCGEKYYISIEFNGRKNLEINKEDYNKIKELLPNLPSIKIKREIKEKIEAERAERQKKIDELIKKARETGKKQLLSFDIKMKNNCDVYVWKYVNANGKVEIIEKEMK